MWGGVQVHWRGGLGGQGREVKAQSSKVVARHSGGVWGVLKPSGTRSVGFGVGSAASSFISEFEGALLPTVRSFLLGNSLGTVRRV